MNQTLEDLDLAVILEQVAKDVFATMLDLDVTPCSAQPILTNTVGAVLTYRQPQGLILNVVCERRLALSIASRLTTPGLDERLSEDDVIDSICEITNMLGGMLRSHLDLCVTLDSIPVPLDPALAEAQIRDTVADVMLFTDQGLLHVSLLKWTKCL